LPGLTLVAALVLGPAAWRVARVATVLRRRARVPRASAVPPPADPPPVTVLVPARNEERCLGPCLASLSAQTYATLEIVVIDDGSTDRTPALIAAAARRDPRIRALRLEGPPPGWTGKNFALASGVDAARGTWLCFTDADTVHAPGSIAHAVGFARRQGLALLSLTSHQRVASFWERVVQPVVFGLLDQWFPLDRVNDPGSPVAAANGIFILVSREAYRDVGGHRAIAGEVLEDVALAGNVKGAGWRTAFVDGRDLVEARMYESLAALRRGWTKNLYALRGRRPLPALASALEVAATLVWPAVAALAFASAGWPAAAALAGLAVTLVVAAEVPARARRGDDPWWSVTLPLGAVLVLLFLLESAIRAWLGVGVAWKGRRYAGNPRGGPAL
jgi:chlorobactene glucosyltransferase